MKKTLLIITVFSALTFSGVAQNNKVVAPGTQQQQITPQQKADKETEKISSQLGLDATQKTKFNQLSVQRITDNRAIRTKASTKEEKQKAEELCHANNVKFFSDVNSILNAQQQTKWAEHKKKMEARQANKENQN